MLLIERLTEDMAKNFIAKFNKYGNIMDYLSGEDLFNAVVLVNENVITAETLYYVVSKNSTVTISDLAVIYNTLRTVGRKLYLDGYVYSNEYRPEKSGLYMLMEAFEKDYCSRERKALRTYLEYYIFNMQGRDIDDRLVEQNLYHLNACLSKKTVGMSDLVRSFDALSTYNEMSLIDRHRYTLHARDCEGIILIKLI